MNLEKIKNILPKLEKSKLDLENGTKIPSHFHITEVGKITKHFIDCGGTVRLEEKINLQLWYSEDVEHRLEPKKLLGIIKLSERELELPDINIEVEYQAESIGKYALEFNGANFVLTNQKTDCLAKDNCGIPEKELEVSSCCTPESGCC